MLLLLPRRGARRQSHRRGYLENGGAGRELPLLHADLHAQPDRVRLVARPVRRRRLHHRSARHDLLFFEQEPALRRGERQPDLFRPLGPELHQRRHELRHLPRHTLLFLPAGQHLQSSRSLAGKRRPLRGRGVVPRGILPPVPARILRTDRTGQEVHPHRRARIGDPHSADSLRRVREVHRRVLRPGRRAAARRGRRVRTGTSHENGRAQLQGPPAALRRLAAGQRQSRLHRVQQPRRHAPDEHDLRSGKVETGAGRGSGGDRPRERDQSRHEKAEIPPRPIRACPTTNAAARTTTTPSSKSLGTEPNSSWPKARRAAFRLCSATADRVRSRATCRKAGKRLSCRRWRPSRCTTPRTGCRSTSTR